MSGRRGWTLATLLSVGCGHTVATEPGPHALLASISSLARPSTPESSRVGLVVTMSACWYPASPTATASDSAPRIDPRQCRTIGERVVTDVSDLAARDRIERLTIEDVALKLERRDGDDGAD